MTSQPINNGPLAFQLNSSGLSTTGNCQVLWPVNNGYNPLNDVDVLPHKYWKNFCKLVYGIRIIHQYKITAISLRCAHDALLDFVQEFEMLYYQRLGSKASQTRSEEHTSEL